VFLTISPTHVLIIQLLIGSVNFYLQMCADLLLLFKENQGT
jgi:hypothetical protein